MRRRTAYFGFTAAALALAAVVLYMDAPSPGEANHPVMIQQVCEEFGGVLYTAKDSPEAPAICHRRGAPVSSEDSLEDWKAVVFVDGQL